MSRGGPSTADDNQNCGSDAGGRDNLGRFSNGKPGKAKGTRNRATTAVETLLDGEAAAITRKAVDLALEGSTTAMRLCLERLMSPRKDPPVNVDLPAIQTAASAA